MSDNHETLNTTNQGFMMSPSMHTFGFLPSQAGGTILYLLIVGVLVTAIRYLWKKGS